MQHINHYNLFTEGNKITEEYLESCYIADSNCFLNIDYKGSFKTTGCKGRMIRTLHKLQSGFCCYCMREITNPELNPTATIEHLIPQSIKNEDQLQVYRNLPHSQFSENNLVLTSQFTSVENIKYPPYPHSVAFLNFTLSCNGGFLPNTKNGACCNNIRGNKFIDPIFLYPDIENLLEYLPDGKVYPRKDSKKIAETQNFIQRTNLNYKELVEIRKIWYALRSVSLKQIEQALTPIDRKKLILIRLFSTNSQKTGNSPKEYSHLSSKYSDSIHWQTLLSYRWFHSYFANLYADKLTIP